MKQGAEEPGRFGIWSEIVIGACIEVHRHLGPGLLEAVYEECLCYELSAAGIAYQRQKVLPVRYKGIDLRAGYPLDLIVGCQLLVELKAVERLLPVHEAQVITYLKRSGLPVGLLVNFHAAAIRQGLRRLTNKEISPAPRLPVNPSRGQYAPRPQLLRGEDALHRTRRDRVGHTGMHQRASELAAVP